MEGVFQGYGGNFDTIAYNTPDYNKLAHLEQNVYQFSGAKNYWQMRELTEALYNNGTIRPFREFKTIATNILGQYQGNWLQTEYNAAIAGAQMASKWVDFEQHPAALLEYRTADDDRVREAHQALNGTIRPVSDNFWHIYYPPNGWNCRCTVIRRNSGTPTPESKTEYPEIPMAFRTNLAKTGMVFNANSPFFNDIPANVKQQINALVPDRSKSE